MEQKFWGYHLIVNAGGCCVDLISSRSNVDRFARTLVERIDMVAYGDPQIVHFGSGNKEGFTLIQLIETSNIAAHFVNEDGSMYLDVFSCKEFDPDIVKNIVEEFFEAEVMDTTFILRQAPQPTF